MKKKTVFGALGAAVILAVAVAGTLAIARPDLMPAWARFGSRAVDYGLYCKEHGVPEKFCTLCHADLKEKLLLCPEHGNIPEDICTLCHPENAAKYDIKRCEHELPEHFCPKCHPENFSKDGSASVGPNLIDDGWCREFGERSPNGELAYCKLLPLVRLASADLAGEIGLETAPAALTEYAHELVANAETAYDANRYAEISARVAGFLREARADLGDKTSPEQVLAVVDSAEISAAKTHYISAYAARKLAEDTHRRVSALAASRSVALKEEMSARTDVNQAQAAFLGAEQKLRNLRFDDAGLAQILKTNDAKPLLEIVAPIQGSVVFRDAVLGESVEPTAKLYAIADTSKMWLWIDVYERDIAQIQVGQAVKFSVSGKRASAGESPCAGRVTWISAEVDDKTRTTKVRAELLNGDGKLRANQFGQAIIQVGERHQAITLAKAAVQRYENADLVFLPQGDQVYRPQRIKTEPTNQKDLVEVTWGLKPGQQAVTAGSFLLKTEIMKGSIGAGCCD